MASNGAPLRYAGDAMGHTPDGLPPRAGERRRLDSWKEIAAYLGRSIRTVQRWEREEGLPVHRLATQVLAVFDRLLDGDLLEQPPDRAH
jgi:hypothetical protein